MFSFVVRILAGAATLLGAFVLYGTLVSYPEFLEMYRTMIPLVAIAIFLLVYVLIELFYVAPIHKLNREIAKFYTGSIEVSELSSHGLSKTMNTIITFFTKSLNILRIFKQELKDGRQLRGEVEIASEIQRHVLENKTTRVPSLEIASRVVSATEVGGDSLDIIPGTNGNYYLYIGDVTGHGVASGFIMMMVNSLISGFALNEESSAKILADTNYIVKPRVKQNMMMTCVMVRWNENTKSLYYTGAGHESLLIYKKQEDKVYKVKSGGVALGMIRDSSKILKEQQLSFERDDILVLYTDGISEARYNSEQNGMLFGVDRIIESIIKSETKTSDAIFRQITMDLSRFMGYKHKQYDDISLIVARFVGTGEGKTFDQVPESIPSTYITEWNWGLKTQS